jgi:hypothetical protein
MNHYVGIDVSLEASSVCVVDGNGKIACEGKVSSEPTALIRGNIIFINGKKLARVFGVDPHCVIVDFGDEQRTYRYVCRTKAESFQCERLHYRLPP